MVVLERGILRRLERKSGKGVKKRRHKNEYICF
jgi:hypothetical protein